MSDPKKLPGNGQWAYRSFNNDPNLANDLSYDDKIFCPEFGQGTLVLTVHLNGTLEGTIGGPGWELELKGSFQAGAPATLWFRGSGIVNGALWIYDYLGYVVPYIPEGVNQVPAIVGSVTRAIAHPRGNNGTSPAGVVASFFAVYQEPRN